MSDVQMESNSVVFFLFVSAVLSSRLLHFSPVGETDNALWFPVHQKLIWGIINVLIYLFIGCFMYHNNAQAYLALHNNNSNNVWSALTSSGPAFFFFIRIQGATQSTKKFDLHVYYSPPFQHVFLQLFFLRLKLKPGLNSSFYQPVGVRENHLMCINVCRLNVPLVSTAHTHTHPDGQWVGWPRQHSSKWVQTIQIRKAWAQ